MDSSSKSKRKGKSPAAGLPVVKGGAEDIWSSDSPFEAAKQDWTWNDTTPLTVRLEIPDMAPFRSRNPPKFVLYAMRVTRGFGSSMESWAIETRYSELAALQADVLRESGLAFALPPKKMFGNLNPDFIMARRQQLEAFLQGVVGHHAVRHSVAVKHFVDAKRHAKRLCLQSLGEVSMYLRSETKYTVIQQLGHFGWRFAKGHFIVQAGSSSKKVLTWTPNLRRSRIPREELRKALEWIGKIDHRNIITGEHVALIDSERGAVVAVRDLCPKGSLKDLIYGNKDPTALYPAKYSLKTPTPLDLASSRLYGQHVLEGLQFLHQKSFPYGHLHSGNVLIGVDGIAKLSDLECALLSYVGVHSSSIAELRKVGTLEDCDVYCFGHLMYEMGKGEPLMTPTCDFGLSGIPQAPIIEMTLGPEATQRTGMPKVSALLSHAFFAGAPGGGAAPSIKLTSRVKEIFTTLTADRTAVLQARQHQAREFRKTESKEESKKSKQAIKDRAANRLV